MPELPEVETVCRGLKKQILNQPILKAEVRRHDLRRPIPQNLAKTVTNTTITNIHRRSKYALLDLSNNHTLLLHLGMSGRIMFNSNNEPLAKHDHIILTFPKTQLRFNDPRRFGMVLLEKTADLAGHPLIQTLGPEPLTDAFTADTLHHALKNKTISIKTAIMDAKIVVGIGNIYASESLFRASILPNRAAKSLKKTEIIKLVEQIKQTLADAIAAGGSSLNDYVQTDGTLGYFQHQFRVYSREGQPCTICKKPIQKIILGQRSTFYCKTCQS